MQQTPPCQLNARPRAELQNRIAYLQQRLANVAANPALTAATKAAIERFELETIRNLKGQCRLLEAAATTVH